MFRLRMSQETAQGHELLASPRVNEFLTILRFIDAIVSCGSKLMPDEIEAKRLMSPDLPDAHIASPAARRSGLGVLLALSLHSYAFVFGLQQ